MRLSVRLRELQRALGLETELPGELARPVAFGQSAPDIDELARWLGARCAERPEPAMRVLCARPFDPLAGRVLREALGELARSDADAAARHARSVAIAGPFEDVLQLGALARASALAAAGTSEADVALVALGGPLVAPRPVARMVAMRLGELGLGAGPIGRRARALLEDTLSSAIESAPSIDLDDESGAAWAGRIADLVGVLATLAAHREGLTQRLSALAPAVPPAVGPLYIIAYLTALGGAHDGPYAREVHDRLRRAAADSEPRVRALAIAALGERARTHPELVDPVVEALTDADEDVRTAAALAMSDLPVSAAAASELEDMIEVGSDEAALAATRALARAERVVSERLLGELGDPLVRATARLLARGDDAAFAELARACEDGADELGAFEGADDRVHPMGALVDALRAMSPSRAALWLRRFATGSEPDALGQAFYVALEGCEAVPSELVDAGRSLLAMVARGEDERVATAALVASRLLPGDARLEALLVERTATPVTLLALAELDRISAETAEHVIALAGDPDAEHAALAIAALARCDLREEQARAVAAVLAAHVVDTDPLCEPAHAALVELVERGALRA